MATDSIEESVSIIKKAESDFITSTTLDEATKTRQLVFLSILRNSIGYWENVMEHDDSPWWRLNSDFFNRVGIHEGYSKFSWHHFWGVLLTGLADAVGGVVGAIIPPPVLGAAIGGVVGAGLSAVVDSVYP